MPNTLKLLLRQSPQNPCSALRALNAIANVASHEPDLQTLYGVIHREVCKIMECDAFYVCRYNGRGRLDFEYRFDEGVLEPARSVPLGTGPTSYCIRQREPFILSEDNAAVHHSGMYLGQTKVSSSAMHVPLLIEGEPIGVLSAQCYRTDAYDETHLRVLSLIAAKAAGAIRTADLCERNSRHVERLNQLAHALRVREQTIKNVGDLVMTCDLKGDITAYNDAVCRALGYGRRELMGQSIVALRTSERGDWDVFRRARGRRITVVSKAGHPVPLLYSTRTLDENGVPAGYLVVARNLSDVQRAEEDGRAALALERRRISRDLHDGLIQSLSIAKMQLHLLLGNHALDDKTRTDLEGLQDTLTQGLAETRQYIVDLKHVHLESDGLVCAARRYADDFGRVTGLNVTVDASDDESPLGDSEDVQLFFILREALSNVRKHAAATNVWIRFERLENLFEMCVEDDGHGFRVSQDELGGGPGAHWGIPHIRERAHSLGGRAEIASCPGSGTRICIRLPIAPGR
jgi:PAS domain S-box-containing protein